MVGKIGTATKRAPAKPAVKRVAKPGVKPGVKRVANAVKPGVKRVANAVKPGVKRVAKPGVKRAGVKRATPKAKKVNFNKLLIIIRNVANRTHKKGRMTGGGLDDAKNTIFKYLVGSELTSAIISLINKDDRDTGNNTVNTKEDNKLLRTGDILKVGDGSLAELLSAIDTVLNTMGKISSDPVGFTADNIKNIASSINDANDTNNKDIETINAHIVSKDQNTSVGAAAKASNDIHKNNPIAITTANKAIAKATITITIDEAFKVFEGKSLAISTIEIDNIKDKYTDLINKLVALKYDDIYIYISNPTNKVDEEVKKNFAMLMIAITLAKIHKIIEAM